MRFWPVVRSGPIVESRIADQDHGDRLEDRAARQHDREGEAHHHEREILGRAEDERELGQRRGQGRDHEGRDGAGEERADRRDAERDAGPALPRHLVAVERGHDGARFAGDVEQDRGGRAAILRAVIDPRQHDQRRDRVEPEGDRQEDRDGRDRSDARQHADQGAEQAAGEAQGDVHRRKRDAEAGAEIETKSMARSEIDRKRGNQQHRHGLVQGERNSPMQNSVITSAKMTSSCGRHFVAAEAADQHGDRRRDEEAEAADACTRKTSCRDRRRAARADASAPAGRPPGERPMTTSTTPHEADADRDPARQHGGTDGCERALRQLAHRPHDEGCERHQRRPDQILRRTAATGRRCVAASLTSFIEPLRHGMEAATRRRDAVR